MTLQNCKAMMDRSKTIGASEIGAILGVNPYMTPADVWMVKTLRKPEFAGNEATERGLILEPAIAIWFAKQSKYKIDASQVRQFASRYCSATPDFTYKFDYPNKGKVFGLLETKSLDCWKRKAPACGLMILKTSLNTGFCRAFFNVPLSET